MEGTILSGPFLDSVYGRHNHLDFRYRYSAGEELLCHLILWVAMWRASMTVIDVSVALFLIYFKVNPLQLFS